MKAEIILGRIFLVLLAALTCIAVLDVLSRQLISSRSELETRFPVEHTRRPRPYTMFGGEPSAGGLNRLGYRGKAPAAPKPAGEFRIFVLGGSTVLNGNPPVSDLLEQAFDRSGASRVRVYNFGVMSSVSGMDLARTVYSVADFQPDLVVFYSGGNDILHPWRWDPRPGYPFNFIAYESNPLLESDVGQYPALALLAYGSHLARCFFPSFFTDRFVQLDRVRRESGWKTAPWKDAIARTYAGNLAKAARVSGAFGAGFVGFFQPLVYSKQRPAETEKTFFQDGETLQYALDMQARIRREVAKARERFPFSFHDLSRIYDQMPEAVFSDAIHTRQPYKQMVAAEMHRRIAASGLTIQ